MRKMIVILTAALISAAAFNSCGTMSATHKLALADPFVILEGGRYYAFGTNAPDGFHAYSSQDLKTWTRTKGGARDGYALHKDDAAGDKTFWAPEVYKIDGRFYMLYTAEGRPRIAVSDNVTGPYLRYGGDAMTDDPNGIDNTLFCDDDGTWYMYWVRFGLGKGNEIRAARLSDDLSHIVGDQTRCIYASEPWELMLGTVTEAPTVFKHKGLYYMTYSGNDFRSQDYAVGFAVASSPLGPWEKYEGNPILRRPGALVGTGHSSIFRDKRGRMVMVFHAHRDTTEVGPRKTYFTRLRFRKGERYDILTASDRYSTPVTVR